MLSLRLISMVGVKALMLAGTLLVGVGSAWSQMTGEEKVNATDPFAAYHSSLTTATERALTAPALPPVQSPPAEASISAERASPTLIKGGGPATAVSRVQRLRPVIEPILRQERVPSELAAIVLVESGGQLNALSPKGARGIWQFMPDTARRYGLVVTPERDERTDIERSTRAAAHYLRDLFTQFGNWPLAFAAYNAGEKAVQRAVGRGSTNDFWKLTTLRALPLETRNYVPAVVNAMRMFGNASGFSVPVRHIPSGWILYAETRTATGEE